MRFALRTATGLLVLVVAMTAEGLVAPARPPQPNLESWPAPVSGFAPRDTRAALVWERLLGLAEQDVLSASDPVTGAPRAIYSMAGALSEPVAGGAELAARAFLRASVALWGATEADLHGLVVEHVFESPLFGVTHVRFRQEHQGVPVYGASLGVHVDPEGRVLAVSGIFFPAMGALDSWSIPLAEAVRIAARDVGRRAPLPPLDALALGPHRATRLADPSDPTGFGVQAAAVAFRAQGGGRAAYVVGIADREVPAYYEVIVDAASGEVLARVNRTAYAGGRAFDRANPPLTGAGCPPGAAQVSVSFDATTESPAGYLEPAQTGTVGNNVRAQSDTADVDYGPVAPPTGAGRWDHNFSNSYATSGNAAPDLNAAITNLFYTSNYTHDRLYARGFDEPSRNFQAQNFGKGGVANDEVWADAQDGGGTNNANFSTDVDGLSPRMQMYLWTTPNRDGDFDNTIIVHEYGHGLSHRLVGVNCLGGAEAGAMGEGWGDFLACSFYDVPVVAAYASGSCTGIRRSSYQPGVYPFTYRDVCSGGCQVHSDGEIWAAALWYARELLATRFGSRPLAACVMETLVVEGMKRTTCNPTMLNARDAILSAARDNHPDLVCTLWTAFADRGMGYSATSNGSSRSEAKNLHPECSACSAPPAAPSGLAADVATPNQVRLSWNAVPGATLYVVTRTTGSCGDVCTKHTARLRATTTMTNYTDTSVQGNVPVTYQVRAASSSSCVGNASCVEVTPTGGCALAPRFTTDFPGVQSVTANATTTPCALTVNWGPAISNCPSGPGVRYNIYRGTTPTFSPSPANRQTTVAAPTTSWVDASGLVDGTTYYYLVRAEDTTTGNSGPNGGNEDANAVRRANAPRGAASGTATWSDSMDPAAKAGWTHASWPATVPDDWAVVQDANSGGTRAWRTTHIKGKDFGTAVAIKDLVLPPVSLSAASVLTFDHKIQTESQWDGAVLEISVDGGITWQDLTAQITAGGYNNTTFSVMTVFHSPNTNRLWTGTIPAGFNGFQRVSVNLASFAGARDALIRWRSLWDYDSPAGTFNGWYIDNVQITGTTTYGACSGGGPSCSVQAQAQAGGLTTYCEGDSVQFSGAGSTLTGCSGGPLYQWLQSGFPLTGETAVTYDVPPILPQGSYSYSVRVTCSTDATCTSTSAPIVVTIDPPPTAVAAALGATTVCVGGTVALDAAGSTGCTGGFTYQWFESGGAVAGATAARYDTETTLTPGSYSYTVTVACAGQPGCAADSAPVMVTVEPAPLVVQLLKGVKNLNLLDADFSWQVETTALGGYRLYATDLPPLLPAARAGTAGVTLVGQTAVDPLATALSAVGALQSPPNPALLCYQVLALCADGLSEGAN